ncbi:MAG: hypothetical protein ABDI19_09420 [Armatimonadota bacterium]
MRIGWWLWLCGNLAVALASPVDSASQFRVPIRRVVVYKDGHCFTQREASVVANSETVYTSDLPHALLGTVWAYTRDAQAKVVRVQGLWQEEKRRIAPQNLAELLALNAGAEVELELMPPSEAREAGRGSTTEVHRGVLRVFKPELRYADAYPDHDPPPAYSPQPTVQPRSRRDGYYYGYYFWQPPAPPDFVQDEWSRTVSQSSFAVETARGLVMFSTAQVKRLRFLSKPKQYREVTLRRPQLEILLSGFKKGQRVPLVLAAIEKGIRWVPEYQLILPERENGEATLQLNATLINELSDLQDVELYVAVGAPQFIMEEQISPLAMRETFMRLSSWFGEPEDIYGRAIAGQAGGFGGFGGAPNLAPTPDTGFGSGGMGFPSLAADPERLSTLWEPCSLAEVLADPQVVTLSQLSLIRLPRLTLPKGMRAHYSLLQQRVPCTRACFWAIDLTAQSWQRPGWYGYPDRERRRFRTFEELAYALLRQRNLWGEVQEALILKNTGSIPWTTAPAVVMQRGAALAQDMLLFTPPGEEAVLLLGPAPQVNLSHTRITTETRWEQHRQIQVHGGKIEVTNSRKAPVRLIVRVRFVGHYKHATREPQRISRKAGETEEFWNWYYQRDLQNNPYTELVWDVEVPPGVMEWEYRFEQW